jgi:tRNA-modifying protein YgfZ
MAVTATRVASRPRDFVAVRGPGAEAYLQAMVSNDVEKLAVGDSCEALLLTPKARVIAPLVVLRRGVEDFLLLTEPGVGERVRSTLLRMRFAAKCEIEAEEHVSSVVLGEADGIPTADYGVPAVEVLDAGLEPNVGDEELELLRIKAGTPRIGREIDDRILPAEAGLDARAIDFAKGCYPGQEPIARQHYRGRVNRSLRVLEVDGEELPDYDAELAHEGKTVGRVTSAAREGERVVALAFVRVEVPRDAVLDLGGRAARPLDWSSPRP